MESAAAAKAHSLWYCLHLFMVSTICYAGLSGKEFGTTVEFVQALPGATKSMIMCPIAGRSQQQADSTVARGRVRSSSASDALPLGHVA